MGDESLKNNAKSLISEIAKKNHKAIMGDGNTIFADHSADPFSTNGLQQLSEQSTSALTSDAGCTDIPIELRTLIIEAGKCESEDSIHSSNAITNRFSQYSGTSIANTDCGLSRLPFNPSQVDVISVEV